MRSRPTHRALMVRLVEPDDLDAVAAAFHEHDRTDLPARIGVARRTLLHYHGLYMHLVEGDRHFQDNMFAAREDPLFREIDRKLATLLTPFDPDRPSMAEAQAQEFYHWSNDPPPAAYRQLLEIEVEVGRGEEFERTWSAMADAIGRQPENAGQSLSRDRGDARTFYVVSDWTSEEAFDRFRRSPEHGALAEAIRSLSTRIRMTGMHIRVHKDPA
ncbi:hypothetical protein GCM10010191_42790 [Actinomadura vinacea]|uniref:ABM domain-containing protein n=1 Tax=Actinomadura vinacea TaxID=115336 RepID=A0ABN3JD06_9ACTN